MRKILAEIDGSEHAWKALDLAVDIHRQAARRPADRAARGAVRTVSEALRAFAEAEQIPLEEEARFRYSRTLGDHLARSAEARPPAGGLTDVAGRTVEGKSPDQILEVAASEDVDMIVLGSRGPSDARALFLGSVSHKLANHAACTCVTVK